MQEDMCKIRFNWLTHITESKPAVIPQREVLSLSNIKYSHCFTSAWNLMCNTHLQLEFITMQHSLLECLIFYLTCVSSEKHFFFLTLKKTHVKGKHQTSTGDGLLMHRNFICLDLKAQLFAKVK